MLGYRRSRQALGESVCDILRPGALEELDMPISYEISQIMHSSINVTCPLPIRRILAHHDTGGVILPYLGGFGLYELESAEESS